MMFFLGFFLGKSIAFFVVAFPVLKTIGCRPCLVKAFREDVMLLLQGF